MTPSAEPNAPAVDIPLQQDLLQDGEEIILAIKPSAWFVILVSWKVVVLAGIVALAAYLANEAFRGEIFGRTVTLISLAIACLRIMVGCFQWMGQLYILTNLRVLRIRGVLREDVFECPLKRIRDTLLSSSILQRLMNLGSLFFVLSDSQHPHVGWIAISNPDEVRRTVTEAMRRLR